MHAYRPSVCTIHTDSRYVKVEQGVERGVSRKADQGQATRGQLIAVATRLFAEHGYEDASVEQVLAESGLSRGALYYHFRSKEALFLGVLESVEADVMRRVRAAATEAARSGDQLAVFRAASLAWVHLAAEPAVRRIVLLDAPAVLGWQRWRELDEEQALGSVKNLLARIAEAGRLERERIDLLAHVWLAALDEIALYVAGAPDREAAMRQAEDTIDRMLEGQLEAGR